VQALHDLALAHERVGSAHEALNDLDQAAKHYAEMQRLFGHLDTTAPKDGAWRVDRAVADERLGDLAQKRQQAAQAIAHYQAGVTKLSALTESDQVRRRLAILKGKLGALDKDRAAEHYASEAALWARVRSEMPDDVHAIAGEAIAHGHLAAISQGSEAVTHASTQVTLLRSLTQVEPGRVDWQHDLGVALLQLGVAHEGANQVSEATLTYLEAEATLKQLKRFNHDLAAIELRLAAISFRQNDMAKAREYAAESLRLLERDESSEAKAWRETAQTLLQSLR
jgi:tetratricopeptide (TPR) repeat protein